MHRLLRLFLAAFLMLAVPLHGLAGVTMAACALAHGERQAMHVMEHDHAAMEAGMDHGAHHGDHPGEAGEDHKAHNCAACAACGSLSAAPITALDLASASPVPSVAIPFLEVRHA